MAWNSPATWVDGVLVTAANLNAQVRDNLAYLKGSAGVVYIENAIEQPEAATPATPASGRARLWPATSGLWYGIDDAGVVYPLAQFKARVYNSANIATTSGAETLITYDSERYDVGAFHSTSVNPGRLTIPAAGAYRFGCCLRFAANAVGNRRVRVLLNNTTVILYQTVMTITTASISTIMTLSGEYTFAANDYIEIYAAQDSGGALNIDAAAAYSPEAWICGPL